MMTQKNKNFITKIIDLLHKYYIDRYKLPKIELLVKYWEFPTNEASPNEWGLCINDLNNELYHLTRDRHFKIIYKKEGLTQRSILEIWDPNFTFPANKLPSYEKYLEKQQNKTVQCEIIESNILYLKVTAFPYTTPSVLNQLNSIQKIFSDQRHVIIDIRKNEGGFPQSVAYLTSFLFPRKERIHLNTIHWFPNSSKQHWYTDPQHNGPDLSHCKVLVLIDQGTFSAAEEFAYNLQSLKRAKIMGTQSRGGAHPTTLFPVNEHLNIAIPVGESINPITKTNWEGIGVSPDILSTKENIVDEAVKVLINEV